MARRRRDRGPKPSADEAFTDAYRSYRVQQGQHPSTLPPQWGVDQKKAAGGAAKRQAGADGIAGAGFFADDGEEEGQGGGFLPDDEEQGEAEGAGFLPDDEEEESGAGASHPSTSTSSSPTHIPLSSVPHALALLGLPTNDDGILQVFANGAVDDPEGEGGGAASSSSSSSSRRRRVAAGQQEQREKFIAREDFLQVCAVLLDDDNDEDDGGENGSEKAARGIPPRSARPSRSAATRKRRRLAVQEQGSDDEGEDDDDDSDVYQDSEESQAEEDAAEEAPSGSARRRRRSAPAAAAKKDTPTRRRRKKAVSSDSDASDSDASLSDDTNRSHTLSTEQREIVHSAWQLLTDKLDEVSPGWSHVRSSNVDSSAARLGLKELRKLSVAMGEKLSEKDLEEMLSLALVSFAPASSKYITKEQAKSARQRSASEKKVKGLAQGSRGKVGGEPAEGEEEEEEVGIDEFAGVLLKGRMI